MFQRLSFALRFIRGDALRSDDYSAAGQLSIGVQQRARVLNVGPRGTSHGKSTVYVESRNIK